MVREYRRLGAASTRSPIHLRAPGKPAELEQILEASRLIGGLLCDGIGDSAQVEGAPRRNLTLAYNILQGAGVRITKTEFVSCPSCGRTLFNLQTTTERIKAKTGHLKGVKIAIMGCIVNGPGEMADADFGYVGGAPGKVTFTCATACRKAPTEIGDTLIDLINARQVERAGQSAVFAAFLSSFFRPAHRLRPESRRRPRQPIAPPPLYRQRLERSQDAGAS